MLINLAIDDATDANCDINVWLIIIAIKKKCISYLRKEKKNKKHIGTYYQKIFHSGKLF